jgi:WD40 repeat protein
MIARPPEIFVGGWRIHDATHREGALKSWIAGTAVLASLVSLSACRGAAHEEPSDAAGPTVAAVPQRMLTAHTAAVMEVAFSPDGTLLASGSVDGTVKLSRVPTGELATSLDQHEGVTSLAFSPDGRWLATGSYDRNVRIWNVEDRSLARTLTGHTGTVWCVAFSPDGERLASGGEDKMVRLWRTQDGVLEHTLGGHNLNVWSVSFSPDGRQLASGSFDRTIKIWNTETGALGRTLTGHTQAVVSAAFSPSGVLVASGGDDSSIKLWAVSDGRCVRTLTGGIDHVYTLAFSPDGRWLASGGRERGAVGTLFKQALGSRLHGANGVTVRLWRVSDGRLLQGLAEHSDDVWSVAISPDGRWLASSSEDGTVRLASLTVAAS